MTKPTSTLLAALTLAVSTFTYAQTTEPAQAPASTQPSLTIGDPAPAFVSGGFAQGTPLAGLEKGHVYVVEFWATWCAPCVAAMPHLSKLSQQYKDTVTVIGFDASEYKPTDGSAFRPLDNVTTFLQDNPGRMTYSVAVDTADGDMSKSWLTAAGRNTIPSTFIIDRDLRVAWIGHPNRMEEPLKRIVAGTFDPKAYMVEEKAAIAKEDATLKPLRDAFTAKQYREALNLISLIELNNPELAERLTAPKFTATLNTTPADALPLLNAAVDAKDTDTASTYAQTIANTKGLPPEFYAAATKIFESQVKPTPGKSIATYMKLSHLATTAGDPAQAVAYAEKALADVKAAPKANPKFIEALEQQITQLKAQLPNKG